MSENDSPAYTTTLMKQKLLENGNAYENGKQLINIRLLERYVNKLREEDHEKLQELCKLHLSFLVDVTIDIFEMWMGEHQHEKQLSKGRLVNFNLLGRARKNSEPNGDKLDCEGKPQCGVEASVSQLISFLQTTQHLSQEGIFRKTGNITRQRELKTKLLQSKEPVDLVSDYYTTHDCASVLKLMISDFPEPLLHEKFLFAHLYSLGIENIEKRKDVVSLLLQMMSNSHYSLAKKVFAFLHTVTLRASQNLMNADNLAAIFSPHMIHPKKLSSAVMQDLTAKMSSVVSFIITHAPQLFKVSELLALDAMSHLRKINICMNMSSDSLLSQGSTRKFKDVSGGEMEESEPIETIVTFADRCTQKSSEDKTAMELAKLHAHVHSMADSDKKRLFIKRVAESKMGKEVHHSRSRSIGECIKRRLSKRSRSRNSNETPEKIVKSQVVEPATNTSTTRKNCFPSPTVKGSFNVLQESPYLLHRTAIGKQQKRLVKDIIYCNSPASSSTMDTSPFTPSKFTAGGESIRSPVIRKPLLPANIPRTPESLKKVKPAKVLVIHHKRLADMEDHQATPPRMHIKMALADSGFTC